jgi:4Fe-4S iron-sulfur cluster binding domain/DR2241 stabilising domain
MILDIIDSIVSIIDLVLYPLSFRKSRVISISNTKKYRSRSSHTANRKSTVTPPFQNPALKHFVAQIGGELILAQVLIRRQGSGYELRHVADNESSVESLRAIKPEEARALAQFTANKEFRPLKSAPTLQRGWRIVAVNETELEIALSRLYPGAVADWHAAQNPSPPVTHYRDYVNRQSGMYRITALLTDEQAIEVAQMICDAKNCLKRRLWTVPGLQPDAASEKSLIPCLEPCAVLMEAARKAFRDAQEIKPAMTLADGGKAG